MTRRALTARNVASEAPPANGRKQVYDATLPGLVLRVTANGTKTFQIVYRIGGRQRRMTLGRHPHLKLAAARERARAALEAAEAGEDPAARPAASADEGRKDTVATVAREFVDRHCRRNTRSWRATQRLLENDVVPVLGERELSALTRRDVRDLVDGVVDSGRPVQANRVLSAVKTMLNWAVDREIINVNPADGVRKPTAERPRERVLSDAELVAVWRATRELAYPARHLVRVLILTGARREEVRGMTWPEIDMSRGLWTLPAARSKSRQARIIPLSSMAIAELEDLPTFGGCSYVWTVDGTRPYADLQKPKVRLDRISGVEGWTLHDLRRTVASGMGDLGIAGETIARVLGHSEGAIAGITARYNRADQVEAKRRALESWAGRVKALETPAPSNVVSLT